MKYLLLIATILFANYSYTQPTNFKLISVDETSAVFEFDLGTSYSEAGICWSTSSTPDVTDNLKSITDPSAGTYQMTITGLSSSTLYYFRAYSKVSLVAFYSSELSIIRAIWDGSTSNSWSTLTNWQNSRDPDDADIIIIPDVTTDPIISSNTRADNLIIKDGGNITINTGARLALSGYVRIEGASGSGGIVIEENGVFTVSGTSTYERYIPADSDWHLISIPNSNSNITQLTGLYVQSFDEATPEWVNLTSSSSLIVGQGYSVLFHESAQTISFTGSFNNGSQSIGVTNADTGDETETYGWNLVGNPYPSPIDWGASSGWTRSDITGTAQIWNGSTYVGLSPLATNLIPPTQGFFVYSTVTSGSLGMNNNVRAKGDVTFYKKTIYSNLKINISQEEKQDNFQIFFHPDASDEFDKTFDGYKLFSRVEEVPQIYTITNSENKLLAINTLNSELLTDIQNPITLKIGYRTNIEGPISIGVPHIEAFNEDIAIGIYDNVLNVYQDITNFPYEFVTDIGEFNDRFDLYISKAPNSLLEISSNAINCYTHNNNLIINIEEPIHNGKILIYDVLGRPIINKSLTTKTRHVFTIPEKTNIFVVNILEDETFLYRKMLVK